MAESGTSLSAIEARRKAAAKERDAFKPMLDEAYEFAIPYRKGTRDTGQGEKRVNRVFDSTAIVSAFRFAGKIQQDLVPQGFFTLKPGPLVIEASARDDLAKQLEPIAKVVEGTFLSGEWDQAVHEMGLDLAAGTGAILMLPGDVNHPVRDIAVPMDELMLEGGPYNDITGIFWERRWSYRAILEEFPDGKFTEEFRKAAAEKPEDTICLYQDTVWERKSAKWVRYCWAKENKDRGIEETTSRTCPWITPRYYRVPGETYGRGPIMLAMPHIRTTNVAQKIMLQAAAIAMMGIYTAIDDGVFNPDNSPIAPGVFWKVARNGGVLGPSVQRFPDPRIDLSGVVIDKFQMGIRSAMNDTALPPDTGAVRSPTEILERVKLLASDHMGAFGRLVRELVVPAVKRRIEICADLGLIPVKDMAVDQLLVMVEVQSPMALAREQMRMQGTLQYLGIVLQLAPDRVRQLVKRDEALVDVGRALGVAESRIPSSDERKAMDEADAQRQQAAQAVAAGAAIAEPAAAKELGKAIVPHALNGGMV